jgi:quinol monooxygenase YgiN
VLELVVRLAAMPGQAHGVVQALRSVMRQSLANAGCARAHISVDIDVASTFWYCEEWQDAAALEAQMRSDRFSQLLALLETATDPPLLEFRVVAETRGLEYVAAARGATAREPA